MTISLEVAPEVDSAQGAAEAVSAAERETSPTRRHRRNLASLLGGQVITWSFILAWTLVVPRHLGASNWGLLVTGSAVGGILGVLMGLGTRSYLVREMVRRPTAMTRLVGSALSVRLAFALPGAGVLWLYLALARFDQEQTLIICIGCAGVYFALLAEPFEAVFQAVERMEFLAAGDVSDKVVQAAGAIALVLLGFGVVAVATWALVVAGLVLAIELAWCRRFVRFKLATDLHFIGHMLRDSLPYWTMGLFLTLYVWIDSAMLGMMVPDRVVGWYGVPTRLFGTLLFAANILSTAWLPRLIAAHGEGSERFRAVARVPLEQVLLLSFPIAFGAATVSGPMIRMLYGSDFEGAVPVMVILSLCTVPVYLNIMANQLLIAAGRQMLWTKVMIGASIVNPLLNLFAIRVCDTRYGNGAIGAAASLLATELLMTVVSGAFVVRGIVSLQATSRILRALGAATVMAGVVYVTRGVGLIGEVAIGAGTFLALAAILRIPQDEERALARSILGRVRPFWRRSRAQTAAP